MQLHSSVSRLIQVAALVALGGAGCSNSAPPPALYPVTGKVVKGGQAISGGSLQFRSAQEPPLTTLADIDADGSFSAATLVDNRRLPGARPGPYQVTVILPAGGENRSITPVEIDQVFTVETKENQFTIDLAKAKKGS